MCDACADSGFGVYNRNFCCFRPSENKTYYYVRMISGGYRYALTDFTLTIEYEFKSALDATVAAIKHGGAVAFIEDSDTPYSPRKTSACIFKTESYARKERTLAKY